MDQAVEVYPEWKAGIDRFLEDGKQPGDTIEFAWLYTAFDIQPPEEAGSIEEYEKARLRYLSIFTRFREVLLEDHLVALRSVQGVGYEVVPHNKRATWAEGECNDRIFKELKKAQRRLSFVPFDQMTDDERRQHTDAMGRVGRLRLAMTPKRPLPALRGHPNE
ncbi:MAG: hypothetical protein U1E60_32155 [Reyranellaceae bacterium]